MKYKEINGRIVCCRDNGTTLFTPDTYEYVSDESIPWLETDKKIVRLADYSFVYEDDPRIVADEKTRKLEELEQSFDERIHGSIQTSQGYLMQFDVTDSLKMQGALQLMEASEQTEGYLTQANDVTRYHVPFATMKTVLVEMLMAYAACHARKQELRALINNAQTKEELDEIIISWPI